MKRFLIINLIFIFSACGSYPKRHDLTEVEIIKEITNPYFSNPDKDYVYKAQIEVYDQVFGGLFIVKKTGLESHRIVFTTEMGNKIFDFSFEKEAFKVNYILKDLDKKILINLLKKDFQVLITENIHVLKSYRLGNDHIHYTEMQNQAYYYEVSDGLREISRVKHGKEKVLIKFSEINDNIATQILIEHLNIKFKMSLKSIN